MDKALVIEKLNRILELELAGVVRYTHYFGHRSSVGDLQTRD
ncbi:MAG: hypothetical protein RMK75_06955 [Aquificaceae bacterium]|nr:hypothetical protein [Aquificaceae bacterium]MDW8424040.1 hypothetical protein [Aquificaceae bacterium]